MKKSKSLQLTTEHSYYTNLITETHQLQKHINYINQFIIIIYYFTFYYQLLYK